MNTLAPKPVFDDAKTEAFAERLIRALGEAALALMTSIGHRTGLFDTLGQFDLVTAFDAVHDQKDPQGLLTMVRQSLRTIRSTPTSSRGPKPMATDRPRRVRW